MEHLGYIALIASLSTSANASPNLLSYQGRIVQSNATQDPLEAPNVRFEFSILSDTGCVIYRETSPVKDMTGSRGIFDIAIGEGSGTKNYPLAAGFKMLDAFESGITFSCENGGSYPAADGAIRKLKVQFNDGTGWKTITPYNDIRSVPFAGHANKAKSARLFANKEVTEFVLKADLPAACGVGEYLRLIAPLGTFQCAAVTVDGSDVIGNIAGTAAGFSGALLGDVTGTQGATSVDKIKGIDLDMTGLAAGKVLKYDGSAWKPADDDNSGGGGGGITSLTGDVEATGTGAVTATIADGAVTSAKIFDGTIVNADINASAAIEDMKLATISTEGKVSGGAITSGTIGGSTIINTSGLIQTSSAVRLFSGANHVELRAPALTDNLLIQFPADEGTTGQVLTTNGAGVLSWETVTSSGGTVTAVTASAPLSSTGGTTPQISISQANGTTNGFLSSGDWTTFSGKLEPTSAFGGDISGTYDATSVDKIKGKDVVPATYAAGQVLRYDGTANWINAILNISTDTTGTLPLNRGGTGATTDSGARTSLGLGTAAVLNTGAASGNIPVLGLTGLTGDRICVANSDGNAINCDINASSLSPWTQTGNNIANSNTANVGIGTGVAVPSAKLHVQGNIAVLQGADPFFAVSAANIKAPVTTGHSSTPVYSFWYQDAGISNPAANAVGIVAGNQERIRVLADGRVGIGITNPEANVDVSGGIKLTAASAGRTTGSEGTIVDYVPGTGGRIMQVTGTGATRSLSLGVGDQPKITIASDGKVGVNLTTPQANLHVGSDAAITHASSSATGPGLNFGKVRGSYASPVAVANGDVLGVINFGGSYNTTMGAMSSGSAIIEAQAVGAFALNSYPSKLVFKTTNTGNGSATTRMTILENGNVGIGITTPSTLLAVAGSAEVGGVFTASGGLMVSGALAESTTSFIRNTATNGYSGSMYQNAAGTDTAFVAWANSSVPAPYTFMRDALVLGTRTNNPIIFSVGGQKAFQMDLTNGLAIEHNFRIVPAAGKITIGSTDVCGASGCLAAPSDLRLKENIQTLENPLEKVLKLHAVEYDYKDKARFGDKHQIGLIAQEVEKVFPEVVQTINKDEGIKGVSYSLLVSPIIGAIKELYSSLTQQDRRIASLEEQNEVLKLSNEDLKKQNEEMQKAFCEMGKKAFCK